MTDVNKLSESLRAMRRNAQNHWSLGRDVRYSITMDAVRLGDLTDAADLIERQAAELELMRNALTPLANAAAPIEREMLTDADVERAKAALYGADDPHLSARFEVTR